MKIAALNQSVWLFTQTLLIGRLGAFLGFVAMRIERKEATYA